MSTDHGNTMAEVNIQDAIKYRKAERKRKAEGKRQADLQRIRDMRSTTGIDPLQRFPKEIWMKIFEELDPEDRVNLWQIHPLFRDLLEKTRIQDLFPEVLSLIQAKYERLIWPDLRIHYYNEHFRLICKSTRKSFDRRMESNLIKRIQEKETDSSSGSYEAIVHISFDDADERGQLKRILNSFDEGEEKKRFFPQGLNVNLSVHEDIDMEAADIPETMQEFKNDITNLLHRIGDQILHFRFILEFLETLNWSFRDVYIQLQSWISLMPNLRWLEVMIRPSCQMSKRDEDTDTISQYPFPHLPHLERLSLLSSYQPGPGLHNIYGVILEANQHVKLLDLDDGDADKDDYSNLPQLPAHLTQPLLLTSFTIHDDYWGDADHAKISLPGIQRIINCKWNLQTLILSLSSSGSSCDSIVSVMRLVQRFPTLETLKLRRLENFKIRDTEQIGYLELPNLTDFELELTKPEIDYNSNIHFFFSLQFLVHSKYLKKFSWKLEGFNKEKLREHLKKIENQNFGAMVDFRGGLRYLYDANLWHVFPSLDIIYVTLKMNCEGIGRCRHKYLRADIESMSIGKFMKRHECIRDRYFGTCVM